MKKLISLILVLAMAATMIVGCGNKEAKKPALEGTMKENIEKIMEKNPVEFMADFFPTDLADTSEEGLWAITSTTGLKNGDQLSDLAVYEPMMGSMAFSLVMVRVKDAAKAKDVAQEMHDNIDPRKWICVEADDMKIAGYGDVVMLIMMQSDIDMTSQSFVDAFQSICGGELDFTI